MKCSQKSVKLSLWVCAALSVALAVLLVFGPYLFSSFMQYFRGIQPSSEIFKILQTVFAACFYPSALFAILILYFLFQLLLNIQKQDIFIPQNVRCLRIISWSCFGIMLITAVGGVYYLPFLFVAAAAGFVGILLRVLKNVFHTAVELSQENALTV